MDLLIEIDTTQKIFINNAYTGQTLTADRYYRLRFLRKAFGTNVDVQFSGSHYLNQTYQQASEFRKYMRVPQQTVHQTDWIKLGAASCGAAVGV